MRDDKLDKIIEREVRRINIKIAIYIFLLIVLMACFAFKIYVVIKFANVPITEIPAWAYIWI